MNTINAFRDILMKAGIVTITRKTRGDDIDAACGQLAGKVAAKAARHQKQSSRTDLMPISLLKQKIILILAISMYSAQCLQSGRGIESRHTVHHRRLMNVASG